MQRKAICDTIALRLKADEFAVTRPELFNPHANDVLLHPKKLIKVTQNMSAHDRLYNFYKPKLTLRNSFCHKSLERELIIELSLPKLLYHENLHEVTEDDFPQLIILLRQVLSVMGVEVTDEALKTAHVCRIHYGKNILLAEGVWCDFVMKDIEKANVSKIYDSGHTDYRNDGHCIRFHTKYYEFAIYDKIKDLQQQKKSPSRSIEDTAHGSYQCIDLAELGKRQVFRIETRLNSGKTIRAAMERAGIAIKSCTFEILFDSLIARTINLHHWQSIVNALEPMKCLQDDVATMWMYLSAHHKPLKCLQFLGIRCLMENLSCRFITGRLKDNPTAFQLFREMKNYEPQSNYKKQIYDSITNAIKAHEVIELPSISCHKVDTYLFNGFDIAANDNEQTQVSESWVVLDERQRKFLNRNKNVNTKFMEKYYE